MPKFFDIDIASFYSQENFHKLKLFGLGKELTFDKNKEITLIKSDKLNGFNVQISYDSVID